MKLETSIIGLFASFARAGEVIDDVTVGIGAFPDVDPVTNWEYFGCVLDARNDSNIAEYPVVCALPSGGYEEVMETQVLRDRYLMNFQKTNPYYWELAEGYAGPVVDGVAQAPGEQRDRFIQGWLKLQKRGLDGQDRIVKNIWGKLRLGEPFSGQADPTRPVFTFDQEFSSEATSLPDNITA